MAVGLANRWWFALAALNADYVDALYKFLKIT